MAFCSSFCRVFLRVFVLSVLLYVRRSLCLGFDLSVVRSSSVLLWRSFVMSCVKAWVLSVCLDFVWFVFLGYVRRVIVIYCVCASCVLCRLFRMSFAMSRRSRIDYVVR